MSTNENQKQWPMEIVKTVGSSRSKLYGKWTLDCCSLLLRLLMVFALVKGPLVGATGSSFLQNTLLVKCSFNFISWKSSLLCLFTWLPSLPWYTGVPPFCWIPLSWRSPFLIQPGTGTPPPTTLQSGWLRHRVPTGLDWPGVGMNPSLWHAWGSVYG